MSTILVATDFSPASDHALEEAIALASPLGATIELLHVHQMMVASVPPTLDVAAIPPSAEMVARAETALAECAERVRAAGLACESQATFGRPAEEILRRAREIAPRLVVLGAHGHSALGRLLLGSVTEHVLHHAPCPVVVVPRR